MADRSVSVRLQADISNYVAGMTRAAGVTGLLQGATQSLLTGQGTLALVAGGAVVGGFAAAVSAAAAFDKAMSGVQAATMAGAGTMDQLRDAAMQAGADTAYSATEAAAAITEMAKAGVSAQDIMGGGLDGALALAAAGQLDVADAAEIAATALSIFNLNGSQMPHVADLLAAGAGKAQGSVADLSAALNQSALVARNTGLSIEDTTGALALFASNGLLGSDAGTSFKTMLMSLNPRSEEAATLMDDLGLRAYDAQGNFVGLQEYAGQLSEGLSGLSTEQRNAALQTIFGSDAVRAATILYESGAQGVQTWTSNVNDAGYAAEQAAIQQDNLSGDLEKLGGAWETLLISLGEGAQGPLRDVVQVGTGVIDMVGGLIGVWQELPGPVTTGVTALAGFALLSGPVSAGFGMIAGSALRATTSLVASAGAMGASRAAASGLVGMLGGPWGIAFAAGAVVVTSFVSDMQDATDETTRFANAILEGGAAAREAADQYAGNDYFLRGLDEFTGLASSMEDAQAEARALYDAMDPLAQAQQNVTHDTNELADAIDRYGENSPQAQAAAEALARSNDRLAERSDAVTRATEMATAAMDPAAAASQTMADTQDALAEATSAAKTQVDAIRLALEQLGGETVNTVDLESALYAAVDSATGALENMTGTVLDTAGGLNVHTEAGRAAAGVLGDIRGAGMDLISNQAQLGESTGDLTARAVGLREQFINAAGQMGINAGEANRLADQYGLIPQDVVTTVQANTTGARTTLADVKAMLDNLNGRTVSSTILVTTVTRTIASVFGFGAAEGGRVGDRVRGLSTGGKISGPGGPTDDMVPALTYTGRPLAVSDDEWVIQASSAGRYGDRKMAAVNAGTATITLPGLADGGRVAPRETGWMGMGATSTVTRPDAMYGSLVHAEQLTVIEGTPDDLARRLAVEARTAL